MSGPAAVPTAGAVPPGTPSSGVPRAGGAAAALGLVALVTVLGAVLRLVLARQSFFADELSSAWIVTTHGLGGVLRTVHSDAEITPPLFFVLSWAGAQLGDGPLLVRAPSLVAGVLSIPLVFALGARTVGRPAALVAASVTALAPFAAYYAAEARGYAVMMLAVLVATYALVRALDGDGRRWWAVHAVGAAAAMYAHYTCVFVLAAQFAWVLWARPEARRALVLATAGAVVLFLPWSTGAVADLTSPTQGILDALSPFSLDAIRTALEHWSVGYPYARVGLRAVPGTFAVLLLTLALVLGALGALLRRRGAAGAPPEGAASPVGAPRARPAGLLGLVVLLAAATPVLQGLVSLVGSNLFSTRNLAASWPYLALGLGALVCAPRPPLRTVAALLLVAGFAIGGTRTLQERHARPDVAAAAAYVEAVARPGDVVIDQTGTLSPGPLTAVDAELRTSLPVLRAGAPEVRDRPFALGDRIVALPEAVAGAVRRAGPRGEVLLVGAFPPAAAGAAGEREAALRQARFPPGWRLAAERRWPDFLGGLRVQRWSR